MANIRDITRVSVLSAAALLAAVDVRLASAEPVSLTLVGAGPARQLRPGIVGASCLPLTPERILGDPAKLRAMQAFAPAELRFPGGSGSNFYDWRTGLYHFQAGPQSSSYIRVFWANAEPKIAAAHPGGAHLEEYEPFAKAVGANVLLVANLETSTVAEQVAWFRHLKQKNILPSDIELGNEFWIAMLFDPDSMKRWPDEPTAMEVMHRYEEALRPIVGPGAKFAVQSAASAFKVPPNSEAPRLRRFVDWDAALRPADWFEAVTIHLYTVPGRLVNLPGADTHEGMFRYMMACADAGIDCVVADVTKRLPGKEIWVTEWNPGGGAPVPGTYQLMTPPMAAQGAARMMLAFLRHPEVTKTLFFTANFEYPHYSEFVRAADGSWKPEPAALILTWFNHAANAGGSFQRVVEEGGTPVAGDPRANDSYLPIEGGVFKTGGHTILIIQNASTADRLFDPRDGGRLPAPVSVDLLATPDLNDEQRRAASVRNLATGAAVALPALSVARVIWEGDAAVVP